MLKGLFDVFGKRRARILEYWFDNLLFSQYKKPPKRFHPINEIVRNDIAYYQNIGFEDVASFACYLGDDYEWLWGPPDVSAFAKATKFGSGVFSGCASLKCVKIANGVTNIPDRAFAGCSGLTSVTIPASVTSIGDYAFYETPLATVHVAKGDAARIKSLLDGSGYDTGGVKFVAD